MRVIKTSLAVAAGALLLTGCHGGSRPGADAAASAPLRPAGSASAVTAGPATGSPVTAGSAPTTGPAAGPATGPAPTSTATVATTPVSQRTINGTLIYQAESDTGGGLKLVALHDSRLKTILTGSEAYNAEPSPDGKHLAYVRSNGDLYVSNSDGGKPRRIRAHVLDAGFGPSWTGDSSSVLVAVSTPKWQAGRVRISDGRFTALPAKVQSNIHYRPTPDGKRYFYSDGVCRILSARTDGTGIKAVPILGDLSTATNPRRLRACDTISLNRDGSRMTVDLHKGDEPDGDIAGSEIANAVVDTATGKVLSLPVAGTVRQALYLSDGTLLVRAGTKAKTVLILLSADLKVLASKPEPAAARNLELRDYLV